MSPRADRRRRVLRDDGPRTAVEPRKKATRSTKLQLYVEDAVGAAQPRVTDLIPTTRYGLLLCFLGAMLPMALVQALYVWRTVHFPQFATANTPALRLVGSDTLATWMASTTYLLTAAISLVIYAVRRHKVDDYRGRYRVWLWVALACVFASLDVATGLHHGLAALLKHITKHSLWGDGGVWWMLVFGLLASLLLIRVAIDAWRSRGTLLTLSLSSMAFVVAALFYLRILKIGPGEVDMMAYIASLMTAESLLLCALLVYARFIHREASGVSNASAKSKRAKKSKPTTTARRSLWLRFSFSRGAGPSNQTAVSGEEVEAIGESDHEEEVDTDDLDMLEKLTNPNFSQEQRKRQKKVKRQVRRAA